MNRIFNFIKSYRNIGWIKTSCTGIYALFSVPTFFLYEVRNHWALYKDHPIPYIIDQYIFNKGIGAMIWNAGIMAILLSWNWIACFSYASMGMGRFAYECLKQ